MKFNDRLRELRKRKGLTQDEFSKQSGLTRSAISMYEIGERDPNFETLEKLADFFNKSLACASRIGRKPLNQYLSGILNYGHNFIIR